LQSKKTRDRTARRVLANSEEACMWDPWMDAIAVGRGVASGGDDRRPPAQGNRIANIRAIGRIFSPVGNLGCASADRSPRGRLGLATGSRFRPKEADCPNAFSSKTLARAVGEGAGHGRIRGIGTRIGRAWTATPVLVGTARGDRRSPVLKTAFQETEPSAASVLEERRCDARAAGNGGPAARRGARQETEPLDRT